MSTVTKAKTEKEQNGVQDPAKQGAIVHAAIKLEAAEPHLRTTEAMQHDSRKKPPRFPVDDDGGAETPTPFKKKGTVRFRSTLGSAQFAAARSAALRPDRAIVKRPAIQPKAAAAKAPTSVMDFAAATNVDGVMPPDTHGAVGLTEYVETTNEHIDIYSKADPTIHTSTSLAAFFGYFTKSLFDARVVYDSTWNRWVISAEAFPESDTVQLQFLAVSATSSALGSFYIYAFNVTFSKGDFWDYPQMGLDQDSVILTANIFAANGDYHGADMLAIAKSRLYNGWGFSVPVFQNLVGTLAPSLVLDQNANTFLIAAEPGASAVKLYTLTNSSRPNAIGLAGPVDVPVGAYNVPVLASQPGTTQTLDTLDSRFVNAGTQVGDALWQVHTIDVGGFPTPRWYKLNTATRVADQSGLFYASANSHDFNAAIAANADGDVFVTWSSTDAAAGINAQMRYDGSDHNNGPVVALGSGVAVVTSPTFFGASRWGDYASVTFDPQNARQAWIVNEDIRAGGDWGTHVAHIGL